MAIALSLLLLVIALFSAALAVHHDLAAADHDGHEHSDTDLCQWVQCHTGHSVLGEAPTVSAVSHAVAVKFSPPTIFASFVLPGSLASRAPPASFL
jgi:hypothetical protein